jgi:hypothetical protein
MEWIAVYTIREAIENPAPAAPTPFAEIETVPAGIGAIKVPDSVHDGAWLNVKPFEPGQEYQQVLYTALLDTSLQSQNA